MKNVSRLLVVAFFVLTSAVSFGQGTITGKVVDGENNAPLPGVNVIIEGTTTGVSTDFDGYFEIKVDEPSGKIRLSYVGFSPKVVDFNVANGQDLDLGTIGLDLDADSLDEVLVTAYSLAIDRKTPVAVSTLKAEQIALKLGTQEFPEILKSTPGIYATRQGGGYGDGRVNIRGFSSENVAVMINGIPVNDMENGAVYWSNWAGLGDVTSTMQVQRGLGASKVAVPSIGGTINIVTKSIDATEGGSVQTSFGNNGYLKYGMTYSTGLSDKGFAATVSASRIKGDGYVDGTQFEGYNYFINLSQQINEDHLLSFNAFGAQQQHGQHYSRSTIQEYKNTEAGPRRFNPDWGYENGNVQYSSYNYYHKPQISLNHYWTINDATSLTTSVYASFGTGGGRRKEGDKIGSDEYRLGGFDQPIDFDRIVDENIALGEQGASASDFLYNSVNSHKWYGILSTFKNYTNDKLTLSGGIDGRYYIGSHYYQIDNLLGGKYWLNDRSGDLNNNTALTTGDIFGKNYDGTVLRAGVFAQAEYEVTDDFNIFAAADVSNTTYSVENFLKDIEQKKSDKVNFVGYGIKGGANYKLDANNNVFANVGYFERAPFLTNVFTNATGSTQANEDAVNEKVFSAELGYGYRSEKLSGNLNIYRTEWIDKSTYGTYPDPDDRNIVLYYNLLGVNALHQGVELDFSYRIFDALRFNGMASIGDWQWTNSPSVTIRDRDGNPIVEETVYSDGLKVGDAAQTTFAAGLSYEFAATSTLYLDYNYAGDMWASFRPDGTEPGQGNTWKVPAYGLFDVGVEHKFNIGNFDASLVGRINNALNTEYISDANDRGEDEFGNRSSLAQVYYGAGRTYSVAFRLNF